jgi:hypothetical protein
MLLQAVSPLSDSSGRPTITTRHPASPFGTPVFLINGSPVGPAQTGWAGYEVPDATPAELEALRRADYHSKHVSA